MAKAEQKYAFKLTVEGTEYPCVRTVTGSTKMSQEIYVTGVGSETDSLRYGPNGGPNPEGMERYAKNIAEALILKFLREQAEKGRNNG